MALEADTIQYVSKTMANFYERPSEQICQGIWGQIAAGLRTLLSRDDKNYLADKRLTFIPLLADEAILTNQTFSARLSDLTKIAREPRWIKDFSFYMEDYIAKWSLDKCDAKTASSKGLFGILTVHSTTNPNIRSSCGLHLPALYLVTDTWAQRSRDTTKKRSLVFEDDTVMSDAMCSTL